MNRLILLSLLVFVPAAFAQMETNRLRLIVETDLGGDPDDEQSMVRFLLYANEWDIEGIIANRPTARPGENRNVERTGLGILKRLIEAYGQSHASLLQHDPRYPAPELLLSRAVPGYANREDGVRLIINAVDAPDPRPLWFLNWGTDAGSAPSCLTRALDQVLAERGQSGYARFKSRIYLSSSDEFSPHTLERTPPFPLWIDTFRPPIDNLRWYHRFSAITAKAGGFDLVRDVLTGHGPLGALYPTNTTHWQKEGDTMSFLYLVPTGMNDPYQPGWGSWAGRYGLQPGSRGKPYYWANQFDSWNGSTNRDNTLLRWAADLQNDFRARLDWCVQPFDRANHPPRAVLNGDRTRSILRLQGRAGSTIPLDASYSSDPDHDELSYNWALYPEAGSAPGDSGLVNPSASRASLRLPSDAGKEIHVILTIRDDGNPALAAYRRVIIKVE